MGADESVPLPAPPPGFEYMVISIGNYCKIRVIFGSQCELSLIRQAITQYWTMGLKMEKLKLGYSWTFNLNGFPFTEECSSVKFASSMQMICQILQSLNNAGWDLKITTDLSRVCEKTTFFFVRNQVHVPKQIQFPLLCISLSSYDKLLLINIPDDIVQIIKANIPNVWRRGIQADGPKENCYQIKLFGNPWMATGDDSVQARQLLIMLITTLAQRQWILHAAANVKSTADSLFFRYDPEAIPGEASQYFVISLNRTDRLRVLNAPQSIAQILQNAILEVWTVMGGIQQERNYHGSWEFKLCGNPWWSTGNESVMARFLMCKIYETLQYHGWGLRTSLDVTRRAQDKSIFIFSQSQPKSLPVMCLSFTDTDKIRLINAPEQLVRICRDIIMFKWRKGLMQEAKMQTPCSAYEFTLTGNPWYGGGYYGEALHIRSMLCYVIQAFQAHGWQYLISADVSAKYTKPKDGSAYPLDVHSWWFVYEPISQEQPTATGFGFTPASAAPPPSYEQVTQQLKQ